MKKGKLYTVTPWNKQALVKAESLPAKNLFWPGGSIGNYGGQQITFGTSNYGANGNPFTPGTTAFNHYNIQSVENSISNGSYFNNPFTGIKNNPTASYTGNVKGINFKTNFNDPIQRGQFIQNSAENGLGNWKNAGVNNNGGSGGSGSKGNKGMSAGAQQAIALGASALGSIDTGERRGMWDTLDPVHHLAGGRETGFGNAMEDAGVALTQAGLASGNYYLAIAGAAAKIFGGLSNAAFGYKIENEKAVNDNINHLANTNYNADDYDTLLSQDAAMGGRNRVDLGEIKDGWFNSKGTEKAKQLEATQDWALAFGDNSFENAEKNIQQRQLENALRWYSTTDFNRNQSAYGGHLGDSFGGALGLMQQDKYIDAINNRSNAITKGLEAVAQQQPATFTNRFDTGGFVDNFMQDPVAAAMNYIKQRDAEEAQAEAQAAQEAREQEFNNLQTRLMNAETQNQGLQALLEDQGRSIASLQEAQNAALFTPSSAASDSSSDNWKTSAIAAAREVAGDDNYFSLKNFIKGQEGFRSKAYWLKGEKAPTIGYGFHMVYPGTNRPVRMGDTMTQEEAEQGLTTVLRGIDRDLSKKVPNWDKLTSYQRDALRDLAYGTGTGGAHFRKNSKLMTALRNEDWGAAEKELVSRSIANPQYNKALLRRSRQRQDMFREGKYAFGGELGTNGTDFTNGLLQVNAGNTHERNPFGGVPMGLDQQGIPNLVEEGETVFNDYVFSKRLKVPNFMLKDLGLPEMKSHGKRHRLSFADVSKKLAEESEKRPNDPISMNGLNASLSKLMEIQEAERMKEQAKQQSEEINMASDDLALMAACGGKLNKYGLGGNIFALGGGKYYRGRRLPDQGAFESDSRYARKLEGLGYSDLEIDDIITEQGTRTSSTYHPRTKKFKNMGWHRADGKPLYSKEEVDREIDDFVHDKYKRVPKAFNPSNTEAAKPVKQGKRTVYKSYSGKVFNTNAEAKADSQRYFADKRAAATQTPQQAAPASSSTPSKAASSTSSTRSTARRNAAPATTRTAQNNIPAQSNFEAFREYRRNNPFEDTASQNDLVAAAQAMASANGMPLEVEGAAPGTNTNPSSRRWNVGNYDWLSGDFNPSNTAGFIPYNRNMSADDIAREENSDRYKAWTDYVFNNWDNRDNTDVQNYLRELDTRAGGNHLFDADGNLKEDARDYFQYARGVGNNSNHAWGYYHLTPTWADEVAGNASNAAAASNTPAQATPVQGNNGIVPVREEDYTFTEDELNATGRRLDEQARQDWTGSGNPVDGAGQRTTVQGPPTYDTRLRYAPVIGAGLMSLTDALGLTNKPDYSGVSALEAAANRAAYAPNVKAPYIGDYMRYTPFDRLFYANQLQANSRATDRALMNTSAGNRGTAQAAMLANAYNTNNNLGNLYRQAEEYNRGQYERTKEFNRRTNMFNAQMGLEADMANARYTQQASQMGLHGLAQAAAMRNDIDARTGAAKTANLSNLFTSLGNIGRENMAFNMINSTNAARNGYWIDNKGVVHYVGKGDGLV